MTEFQIGPNKHGYVYSETKLKANNTTIYKCRRGLAEVSDKALFLYQKESGKWMAVEADKEESDPVIIVNRGTKAFKTQLKIPDITIPGRYEWQQFNRKRQEWEDCWYAFEHKLV